MGPGPDTGGSKPMYWRAHRPERSGVGAALPAPAADDAEALIAAMNTAARPNVPDVNRMRVSASRRSQITTRSAQLDGRKAAERALISSSETRREHHESGLQDRSDGDGTLVRGDGLSAERLARATTKIRPC